MDDLTKDQKILLCKMYKEYLSRQPALSPTKANNFGNTESINELFMPDQEFDYVNTMCFALRNKEYINATSGSNQVYAASLTDKTIIYMENRFKKGMKEVIEFISLLL